MSVRAEILRLGLRLAKKWHIRERVPLATARRRLKRIESLVPRPPAGTQTTAIDAGGVNAVRVAVRQARGDRCVLYFHGGGYAVGTAKLVRDFTWRIGAAARAHVLYFDYRLAPEHPFPAALEDAVAAYRWLAGRFDPRRIAFMGDSAGGGLALATLYKLRDEGLGVAGRHGRGFALDRSRADRAVVAGERRRRPDARRRQPAGARERLPRRRRSAQSLRLSALRRCVRAAADADPRGQR